MRGDETDAADQYRNGGLLIDLGYLELRRLKGGEAPAPGKLPRFAPDHPAIVEWRALTVISLYVPSLTLAFPALRPPRR